MYVSNWAFYIVNCLLCIYIVYFILYHRPTVHFILPYTCIVYQSRFLAATVVINACLVLSKT